MSVFTVEIVVTGLYVAGEIIIEKVEYEEQAYHVSDVKCRYKRKGKTDDVELEITLLDKLLCPVYDKREKHERVHPHRVVRISYHI